MGARGSKPPSDVKVALFAGDWWELMHRMLLCILEAVECELCLQEPQEVVEVMRCVLFCMLDVVEGGSLFARDYIFPIIETWELRSETFY